MSITYTKETSLFHLKTLKTSYIIKIIDNKYISNIYYGRKVRNINLNFLNKFTNINSPYIRAKDSSYNFSLNIIPAEYPWYGNGDFRSPAFEIELNNGDRLCELQYINHKIYKGKNKIKNLPCSYTNNINECETLEIELWDNIINLKVILVYSVFSHKDIITRNVIFRNEGNYKIKINKALSMSLDFFNKNFNMLYLSGAYSREFNICEHKIHLGVQSIESKRGCTGHQHNPFIAIKKENTDEYNGESYAFSLVYSGNFLSSVELNEYNMIRLQMGINPFDFSWTLNNNQEFYTPEVIMTYTYEGLNHMSNNFHDFIKNNLIKKNYKSYPIVFNNWETTYFNFNENSLKELCALGKDFGIELFLLDDGWFSNRNDDKSSLGDWIVSKKKFPSGLQAFCNYISSLNMKFGLWFEPEMVSRNSDLHKNNPTWCLSVRNRNMSLGRNQYVLDLTNIEVCNTIINVLSEFLSSFNIEYIKWDMNRYLTEVGSLYLNDENQKETLHRYVLGLYYILDEITNKYPKVIFESCASGGGRCDLGMLYYMPLLYISSNNDVLERIKSYYGASLLYPPCNICTHISSIPNRHTNRITTMETRCILATSSVIGVDLNLKLLNDKDKGIIKNYISFYKENINLIKNGTFYRLITPFNNNETAWMFVSKNKEEAIIYYFKLLVIPNYISNNLKLYGLNKNYDYKIENLNLTLGGDELMYSGLNIKNSTEDFQGISFKIKKV